VIIKAVFIRKSFIFLFTGELHGARHRVSTLIKITVGLRENSVLPRC
jgi:hypothetical protein